MGLLPRYIEFINHSVESTLGSFTNKKMLELGNQRIAYSLLEIGEVNLENIKKFPEKTGKEYFTNKGVNHISIDLNAQDGAIALDLAKEIIRPQWMNCFDIITNAGTSEHVEPFEAQYECFKNIHNFLKPGGIIIHIVPSKEGLSQKGYWKNHCNHYYSKKFFNMLAFENNYQLISFQIMDELILTCLKKMNDAPFMADKNTFLNEIMRKEGGIVYSGINDTHLSLFQKYSMIIKEKLSRWLLRLRNLIKS